MPSPQTLHNRRKIYIRVKSWLILAIFRVGFSGHGVLLCLKEVALCHRVRFNVSNAGFRVSSSGFRAKGVAVSFPETRGSDAGFRVKMPARNPLEKDIHTPMAHGQSTRIISRMSWSRTSRLSTKKSLSLACLVARRFGFRVSDFRIAASGQYLRSMG